MLGLAPIKYRNVLNKDGGPIAKLTWSKVKIYSNLDGYEASCCLRDELRKQAVTHKLYANVDGTGSDVHKNIACYKAISEALERWAYYETLARGNLAEFGFDKDPSTSGMAAFPGITKKTVAKLAHFEALERWALVQWWKGNLAAERLKQDEIESLAITLPGHGVVCISWLENQGKWAYGFACANDFRGAFSKAQIELSRNVHVLSKFDGSIADLDLQEKRVLYFSSSEGHDTFLSVVENSTRRHTSLDPKLILNKEIPGPWGQYCTVWRCLFDDAAPDRDAIDFFLF